MNYDSSKTLTEQLEYNGQRIFNPSSQELLGNYFADLKQMFDYAETYKAQLSKIPRGLDDKYISELSKLLYSTMQGLSINKKPVARVFEALQTASDFIALNDLFNNTYGAKQDLYTWIINEVSMGVKVQQRILTSLQNLMTEASKSPQIAGTTSPPEETVPETAPETAPATSQTSLQFPFSKGTDEDPYKYGTKGSGIAQVQQNLGLVQDGKWGPKTDAKIKELAPEFSNGFTNQNLSQVIQKVRGQVNPTAANTSNVKFTPPRNPAQNTAQLAGNRTQLKA